MADLSNPGFRLLMERRSANARMLAAPGPDEETLKAMIAAVCRTPDHGRLVPFRLLRIREEGRAALAQALAAAERELRPDAAEAEVERAREKAHQGPEILALIARIDAAHPKIPASDQWLAVGCALQSLLLAAQAFGVGAAVRSGGFMETSAMRDALHLAANEHLVSLVALGTATDWPPAKPKPEPVAILQDFTG